MLIIGVDYHPSFQEIAFLNQETGECGERQLNHGEGEAEKFYRELKQRGVSVRGGMEATGYARWFEMLVALLGQRGALHRVAGALLRTTQPAIADGFLDRREPLHISHFQRPGQR